MTTKTKRLISILVKTAIVVAAVLLAANWALKPAHTSAYGEINVERPEAAEITDIKEYVLNEVEKHGLNKWEAYEIINCESRWNSDEAVREPNRTISFGLWMINSIHKDISNLDKLDVIKSTRWAIEKRLQKGKWSPTWSCATKLGIR